MVEMLTRRGLFAGVAVLGTVATLRVEAVRAAFIAPEFLIRALPHPMFPVGLLVNYIGQSIPDGWLPARGQWVTPYLFPELFKVVGHSFGHDPNRYLFRLPDLRVSPVGRLMPPRGHDIHDRGTPSYRPGSTPPT
jgi:hypothetical protein